MMFNVVVFGLCLARCLAENFNYAPYSTTGGSTYTAGNAPYSGEWAMPTATSSISNGFKMAMGAPKSRQVSFPPNTFYSQLNFQPSSGISNGYSKSAVAPAAYSIGGYSGHQSSIGHVAQPAFAQSQWGQGGEYPITTVDGYSKYTAGKTAYTGGVLPYSGQGNVGQVAQPAFASVPMAKFYSGQDTGYPTVTAEGYLKDTPEVQEAKKAHFAEKIRIAKYMGNGESQYSYAGSMPQFSNGEAGKAFTSSYYTPTAEGMPTTSPGTFQSSPTAYSHTIGRKKRDVSAFPCETSYAPTFHHALPPHGATFHALPTFGPTFHALPHHGPTFHALPTFGPTFHALPYHGPTFHALPAHPLPHPATLALAHSLPTFHHAAVIDHTISEASSCSE